MIKRLLITGLIALLGVLSLGLKPLKADFNGNWALDKDKSEARKLGVLDQSLIITQSGDQMNVEVKVVTGLGKAAINDSYVVNAKEEDFTWKRANGQEGIGKRTSKWSDDGKTLEVTQEALFDSPSGPVTWQLLQKWSLSEDGKVLTVDSTLKVLPFTTLPYKNVYVKM